MKIGSLFTGYGGLDLAAQQAFGAGLAWTCEKAPGPSAIIAARFPKVSNLGDVTAIDWAAVRKIDILTAGWPCQPWSNAGRRKGLDDHRALWPYVSDAVRQLRPRVVLLENVRNIAGAGELARAVGALAGLGYVGSWVCLRASEVGAPHRRDRIFIVARDSAGARRQGSTKAWLQHRMPAGPAAPTAADTERSSESGRRGLRDLGGAAAAHEGEGLQRQRGGDSPGDRGSASADRWGEYRSAVERWERILGRPAPEPTEIAPRGNRRLSPQFVEWMMGLSEGWVTEVEGISRREQLTALGEGVVPQQALAALELMLS